MSRFLLLVLLMAGVTSCTSPAPLDAPITDRDAPAIDAPRADAAMDAPLIDAPLADAPLTDAPLTDAPLTDAPLTDAPRIPPSETCLFGIDPHPCDGLGFWSCDAGLMPTIGTSRGEYVYTECLSGEECIERAGGAPPVQGYCAPIDRECDPFDVSECGDDGVPRYCADGHWVDGDCGAGSRCASMPGTPTVWRCVDAPLVACDATYVSHCDGPRAFECESVGYVRSIACETPSSTCVTGRGHAGCAAPGAATCDPSTEPFTCSAADSDLVTGCSPTGHAYPAVRCLRTPDAIDCACSDAITSPVADGYCVPVSGSPVPCATVSL